MRIGVMSGTNPGPDTQLEGLVARGKDLEARGFSTMWTASIFGLDAITTLAVVGRETGKIELGTAVVPSYPRHPVAMAQQCLTAQVACGGRFVLGVGLSHQIVIENMLGFSYEKPARHMREYMAVLGSAAARRARQVRGRALPSQFQPRYCGGRSGPGGHRGHGRPHAAHRRPQRSRDDPLDDRPQDHREPRRSEAGCWPVTGTLATTATEPMSMIDTV